MSERRPLLVALWIGWILVIGTTGDAGGDPLKLDGSPTCFRAMLQISEEYAKTRQSPAFDIRYGGSFIAVENVGKGDIDIAFIEFPLRKWVDKAWGKAFPNGKDPAAEYVLAQTALGVVVNKKNTVSRLTHDQLRDILSGKTTSWRKIGGSGGQIRVLTSKAVSRNLASDLILNYRQWSKETKSLLADSNVIASVAGDAGAVGFVALIPDLPKTVKPVAIAVDAKSPAVQPTVENVVLEEYSLVWQYRMILSDKSSPAAHDFARFACSEEASKIVQRWGLFPVAIRNKAESEQRVVDMKAGKGTPIRVCGVAGGEPLAQDLAVPYVRGKALVQVKYDRQASAADATEKFLSDGELLLIPGPLGKDITRGERWSAVKPQAAIVGTLAVGVVVHADNTAKELTLEDLRLIYSGEIDKWPGVEGTAGRIRIFGLASDSGAMKLVEEVVQGDTRRPHPQPLSRERERGADAAQPSSPAPRPSPPATRHARVERRADTGKVVLSVANQPRAIGFVDLTQVSKHETTVKLVAILPPGAKKAAAPTPEKVPEGYPLARPVMLYLSPKASETAKDFFEFVAGGNAREALVAHGIIPNPNPPKFAKDKTLAAVKSARSGDLRRTEGKPERPEGKAAPGPEELASVVPKGPVVEEEKEAAAGPGSKGPSGEAASGKEEPAKTDRPHPSPLPEGEGASDARYFIFGVVGLLVIAAAVIGVNTVAAKRRRERLRRYRR